MTVPSAAGTAALRERLLARLRALMARTVVNGCTADEELAAARMVSKLAEQIDAQGGGTAQPQSWAQNERDSREYQGILEKNTAEAMLKAAVQELALSHINIVAPPRKRLPGAPVERVDIHELLGPHLGMMLAAGGTRMGRDILRRTIDELVYEGALPPFLDMPLGR